MTPHLVITDPITAARLLLHILPATEQAIMDLSDGRPPTSSQRVQLAADAHMLALIWQELATTLTQPDSTGDHS